MLYRRSYGVGLGTEADSFAGMNNAAYEESVDSHGAWYEHRFFVSEIL